MTVITASICSSRLITGSDNPVADTTREPEVSLPSANARNASTETMPVTVTVTFAVLRNARRADQRGIRLCDHWRRQPSGQ
ncbi:MAG: hypothetical protein ACRDVC_05695 [Acidimicrobiales bacterium]